MIDSDDIDTPTGHHWLYLTIYNIACVIILKQIDERRYPATVLLGRCTHQIILFSFLSGNDICLFKFICASIGTAFFLVDQYVRLVNCISGTIIREVVLVR